MNPSYASDEINTAEPTRSARLKWVIVVDRAMPPGRMVNAVACVAASTGAAVGGLVAKGGPDASGHVHPGLPWAGCTVLAADAAELAAVREKAVAPDTLVVDMPSIAQETRVYDEFLARLAETKPADLDVCAVSIVGPRNRVGKLTKRLALLA